MPKAQSKKKSAVDKNDSEHSWLQRENLLLESWLREDVMREMDGTVRNALGHELIAQYLGDHGFDQRYVHSFEQHELLRKARKIISLH